MLEGRHAARRDTERPEASGRAHPLFEFTVFRAGIGQVFERLLLVGIGAHLFTQVFVMAGGTLNLLPVTGVTIPFLSLGGVSLLTNLVEVGIVLALARRLEGLEA